MGNKAVFLDRDGTLVHPRHYPSRAEDLVLYRGLPEELRILQQMGFKLVVITNQGGIAHGYFTERDLELMHTSLQDQLSEFGVRIDAFYYCPHHPEGNLAHLACECECRKPKPGMILQAAKDMNLDLSSSWMVGDILNDVEAGRKAGCKTILVDLGTESKPSSPDRTPDYVARTTKHALQIIQSLEGQIKDVDLDYIPSSWKAAV